MNDKVMREPFEVLGMFSILIWVVVILVCVCTCSVSEQKVMQLKIWDLCALLEYFIPTAEIISLIIYDQPEHQLLSSEITERSDHLPSWKYTVVKNI